MNKWDTDRYVSNTIVELREEIDKQLSETPKFTFYWLDGEKEVLKGDNPTDALNKAGYGGGAMPALDFFSYGECDQYVWMFDSDQKINRWVNKAYTKEKI